ncbi:MAG TPA: NAD(P)H-dependent glycerol-3-phosphate dehydrogenase [Microbacteriaceae bacterium]|nr:NAD(P)H-dependent glycerol-3-phosphate dehydrogenase [Microbacteriaceae bacterium]
MAERLDGSAAEPRRVAVIGGGSWGTTFGKVLVDGGAAVTIWARRASLAREIDVGHRNAKYLKGIALPKALRATTDAAEALAGAEEVYLSVPSQSLRENLRTLRDSIPADAIVVSLMKGLERGTARRMSEIIAEELGTPPERIAVVSGPNLALEIAREQPTAAVVASASLETAQSVAITARNRYFRSFVNTDVVGTEFGGVLKNIVAVAVGIVDGVGFGENTKASIITRGLAELTDFAVAYGAKAETMSGLAGLGDLIATCSSPLSRNNTAGRLLGQGLTLKEVAAKMNQTAEGLSSIAPILELAEAKGVSMPIAQQVAAVLDGDLDPREIAPHLTTDDMPQGE